MQSRVVQNEGIISIQGAVTFETVAAIQKEITCLLHKNESLSESKIDLAEVSVVNSAALGLLVELKKKAVMKHKAITFLNAPERLLSLAQVCGVAIWLGW